MIIKKTTILSDLYEKYDPVFQKFNGSVYNTSSYRISAWRAQEKPNIDCKNFGENNFYNLPTYPYITMDGKWTVSEYCGVLIENQNSKDNPIFIRYRHLDLYPAEDPRIYERNNEIYMAYTAVTSSDLCDNSTACVGMWEVRINLITKTIERPKLICKNIWDKKGKKQISIFRNLNYHIFKNFSYVPNNNVYLDGFNEKLTKYSPSINISTCNQNTISTDTPNNLKSYVQPAWKIALTTPTLKSDLYLYGVAHIRISWELMSRNYNKLNNLLQQMIKKNDVHHSDCYFMSIYRIPCMNLKRKCSIYDKKWELTAPFIITGGDDKHYSYNINFPCGLHIYDNKFNIQYGIGDAIFANSEVIAKDRDFFYKQFDYEDIQLLPINPYILQKNIIISKLNCKQTIKYILPKIILAFDLGGSGLKLTIWKFSQLTDFNLGYWNKETIPDLNKMLEQINLSNTNNFDEYIYNGAYVTFSLAGFEKIWNPKIRNNKKIKSLLNKIKHKTMKQIFNIPEHIHVQQMKDNESHYYGNLVTIKNLPAKINGPLLSIAIGTGINSYLFDTNKQIPYKVYPWNATGNLRHNLTNWTNQNEFVNAIKIYVRNVYNIDMTLLKYIILSGGYSMKKLATYNKTHKNNNMFSRENDVYYFKINKQYIMINNNYNNPAMGQIYKLALKKGIDPFFGS